MPVYYSVALPSTQEERVPPADDAEFAVFMPNQKAVQGLCIH
jgi:hypothetical protein